MACIRSPKQRSTSQKFAWYPYYAGFSPDFVEDLLSHLNLPANARVLDPWNGSGTLTSVARSAGYEAYGCDLNPALIAVARARLLERDLAASLSPLAEELVVVAQRTIRQISKVDLLTNWFHPNTARRFRAIERAIHQVLEEDTSSATSPGWDCTPLASFYYVCLFLTVRSFLGSFRSSNPTWIRTAKNDTELVSVSGREVKQAFIQAARDLATRLTVEKPKTDLASEILAGDSRDLPFGGAQFDAVVGSPPYCTRIDYVVATLPELAVLGLASDDISDLRRRMLGRPSFNVTDAEPRTRYARMLLRRIRAHESKASSTYYVRFFASYVADLERSLDEASRVGRSNAPIALVVQDSMYKDIHVDVQRLITESAATRGYGTSRVDFHLSRTLAAVNPRTRRYRDHSRACESLLILQRT